MHAYYIMERHASHGTHFVTDFSLDSSVLLNKRDYSWRPASSVTIASDQMPNFGQQREHSAWHLWLILANSPQYLREDT